MTATLIFIRRAGQSRMCVRVIRVDRRRRYSAARRMLELGVSRPAIIHALGLTAARLDLIVARRDPRLADLRDLVAMTINEIKGRAA